jgi:periplasmic divalent cation tolerance protein
MHEHCQVVTTLGARPAADVLAESATAAHLAACTQVSGPITSTYWWQGALETVEEWQVTFKTTVARYPALAEHIVANHPYDVPEILCLPVMAGHPPYLRWIDEQTQA